MKGVLELPLHLSPVSAEVAHAMAKTLAIQPANQWPAYVFHKGLMIEARKFRRRRGKITVKQARQAVLKVTIKQACPAGNA